MLFRLEPEALVAISCGTSARKMFCRKHECEGGCSRPQYPGLLHTHVVAVCCQFPCGVICHALHPMLTRGCAQPSAIAAVRLCPRVLILCSATRGPCPRYPWAQQLQGTVSTASVHCHDDTGIGSNAISLALCIQVHQWVSSACTSTRLRACASETMHKLTIVSISWHNKVSSHPKRTNHLP